MRQFILLTTISKHFMNMIYFYWNKIMKKIFLLIMIILTSSPLFVFAKQKSHNSTSNDINKLLKEYDDTFSIGILIKDLTTGKLVYSKNAEHYYMPASNEKILTAFAALLYLGEDFTYKTQLFADINKIQNGVLNDNIYLKFSGDPTLTSTQLDNIINSLTQAGITHINGDVIIDDSAFDQGNISKGSTWDDMEYCWSAPVNAIIVDRNCSKLTLTPATSPDRLAEISLPKYPQSIEFTNNVATQAQTYTNCLVTINRTNATTYTINGCITTSDKPRNIERAIDKPRANIQSILTHLLNINKITGPYNFKFDKINNTQKLLASENSPPLSTLVKTMLKDSDNIIANSIFKTMGLIYSNDSGSFQNGSDAVRDILSKSISLNIPKTTLIDGNGGSRYDFLTPQQIVALLQYAYSFKHAAIFIQALPISGTDGTLKDRMKSLTTLRKVAAKTGTATAVSTLSGYLETRKKHTLVFSIMVNGFVDLPSKYQGLQDGICETLIESN
jgi:D-alanyl-D-alanine carboxypeptidase/D-alanyl-D-alanine-endopeptidase (penicillin-binding protein 4)